jgi:hypothetical protein
MDSSRSREDPLEPRGVRLHDAEVVAFARAVAAGVEDDALDPELR